MIRRLRNVAQQAGTDASTGFPNGVSLEDLQRLVGRNAGMILEIGANDGQDSIRLANAFPEATLHCFEPDPGALELLRNRARASGIQVHPLAIAARDGVTTFFQSSGAPPGREDKFPDGWHLSGSIRPPLEHLEAHPWCTSQHRFEVECRSLDSWAEEAGLEIVDLIWADVQGAEVDLISGGRRQLARTRFLYTEFDDRELYAGQVGLSDLLEMMPDWEVESQYRFDVLLRNNALIESKAGDDRTQI